MEFIKEFLDEGRARVRSNLFASIVLAFCAVNWKVLYFIAFEDIGAQAKFEFFDANTSLLDLYLLPFVIGVVLALGLPFLNNVFHRVVSKPTKEMRSRDDENAHERLKQKNTWAAERQREQRIEEERLISEAETEQRIEAIEDEKIREKLKVEVADLRTKSMTNSRLEEEDFLSQNALYWLNAISDSQLKSVSRSYEEDNEFGYYIGASYFGSNQGDQSFEALKAAIDELMEGGMLVQRGDTFVVSKAGEKLITDFGLI